MLRLHHSPHCLPQSHIRYVVHASTNATQEPSSRRTAALRSCYPKPCCASPPSNVVLARLPYPPVAILSRTRSLGPLPILCLASTKPNFPAVKNFQNVSQIVHVYTQFSLSGLLTATSLSAAPPPRPHCTVGKVHYGCNPLKRFQSDSMANYRQQSTSSLCKDVVSSCKATAPNAVTCHRNRARHAYDWLTVHAGLPWSA